MGLLSNLFGGGKKARVEALLAKGAVIIDVRNPGEFAARNHKGSINIPLQQIGQKMNQIKAHKKPIVVCCASGMRSAKAKSMIANAGMEVENAGGWRALEK
ncbi:MAG: rhodanese-like domain-containing protein [Crocinitomix sp.]|nr:rhodanese-like domain-containing protein [Crocinitomix sp.]